MAPVVSSTLGQMLDEFFQYANELQQSLEEQGELSAWLLGAAAGQQPGCRVSCIASKCSSILHQACSSHVMRMCYHGEVLFA